MTAKNPELTKRGSIAEDGRAGEAEEAAGAGAPRTETPERDAVERGSPAESEAREPRSQGGQDRAPPDGHAPVLDEILGLARVIEQRTGQQKGRGGGPDMASFGKLADAVESNVM